MINTSYGQLVADRRQELLAAARDYRLARRARLARRSRLATPERGECPVRGERS